MPLHHGCRRGSASKEGTKRAWPQSKTSVTVTGALSESPADPLLINQGRKILEVLISPTHI